MVSPMPSCSSTAIAVLEATMPLAPMPASVSPRCSGYSQRAASMRYTSIRSCTPLTFALRMIWSGRSPCRSASFAELSALTTIASMVTSRASFGSGRREFSSIMRVSSAWSSDPQFTPMRTGFWCFAATSIMVRKLSSFLRPMLALPGLMRYLARPSAQAGYFVSRRCPL